MCSWSSSSSSVLSGEREPGRGPTPHRRILEQILAPNNDVVRELKRRFDRLTPADRELVHLKYTEDLRYKQIADQTGLSVSNVGYKLHHILKSLATSMKSSGFGSPSSDS